MEASSASLFRVLLAGQPATSWLAATRDEVTSDGLLFGFLPSWVAAIVISCLASFLTVAGVIMQKIEVSNPDVSKRWCKVGDMVLSPRWILGLCLCVVVPLPAFVLVYTLAPMSLVAPLSGCTILLNSIVAPAVLGERLQPWPDIPATLAVIGGMVLAVLTGARHESDDSAAELFHLCLDNPAFQVALGMLIITLLACQFIAIRRKDSIEDAALRRPSNPVLAHLVLPGFMAAGCSALCQLGIKGLAELIKSKASFVAILICFLVAVVPAALAQLNLINKGLRLYLQMVFWPVYTALSVIANTAFGMLFYEEYESFITRPTRIVLFSLGVLFTSVGISLFRLRLPDLENYVSIA